MSLRVGLDLGSTAIKLVLLDGERLMQFRCAPTAPGQEALAQRLLREALDAAGCDEARVVGVAATGCGKRLYAGADRTVDEISANAIGAFRASGGRARTVVNIGGQDLKVIHLDSAGRVADFRMNDKCAAGTGRFFEFAARILDAPLESFGGLAAAAAGTAELNSTCAVFAESEIVGLLARGVPRENVIRGLCVSVARRAAGLLGPAPEGDGIYLDGGPALNPELARALADELLADVQVLERPQYTAALGAAYSL